MLAHQAQHAVDRRGVAAHDRIRLDDAVADPEVRAEVFGHRVEADVLAVSAEESAAPFQRGVRTAQAFSREIGGDDPLRARLARQQPLGVGAVGEELDRASRIGGRDADCVRHGVPRQAKDDAGLQRGGEHAAQGLRLEAAVDDSLGVKVDQVYIGNCANGTLTDLRQAASVLAGRKVADGVRYIVVPATQRIFRSALQEGLIDALVAAGVVISPSTCGACAGLHMGVMTDGEVTIATTNRNYRGRMGSPDSKVYLANAWVAASAAVAGEITRPMAPLR